MLEAPLFFGFQGLSEWNYHKRASMKNSLRNSAWVDLLIFWIEGLRIPVWLFYILLLVVLASLSLLAVGAEFGAFDAIYSVAALVFLLVLNHVIHRVTLSTFAQFSPNLHLPEGELEDIRRRFVVAPPWIGWIALLLGVITVFTEGLIQEIQTSTISPIIIVVYGLIAFGGNSALTMFFLLNTIRRLRLIIHMHRHVIEIDLFDMYSLRAFSRFSSSVSIGLILMVLASLRFYLNSDGAWEDLVFLVVLGLLAMLVFLIPLIGLHNRIKNERDRRITDLMADVNLVSNKIREAVRRDDLDGLGKYKVGLDAILIQRDELMKVRTWPWNTATIRGLASALMLPILIWFVTRILGRFV